MTKEPSELQCSSPKLNARAMTVELERLALAFPRTDMDSAKWSMLFRTYFEDLQFLTIETLRAGCSRYRRNAENRFFPSPGQLLAACKDPFDLPKGKTYAKLDDLPPPMPADEAQKLIEKVAKKYAYKHPGELDMEKLKEDILARPPIPFVPMTKERRTELLSHLKQALTFRYENPEEAAKYISELPE